MAKDFSVVLKIPARLAAAVSADARARRKTVNKYILELLGMRFFGQLDQGKIKFGTTPDYPPTPAEAEAQAAAAKAQGEAEAITDLAEAQAAHDAEKAKRHLRLVASKANWDR